MMNPSHFCPLLEAAELLGSTEAHDALLQMQSVYRQKLYFVAFIGQYAAGKSCLLNNLLKRRLLPEGTTEITPLLTYIRYGEREEAKLHYVDGAIQILDLEQVAQLVLRAEGGRWDLNRLEFLEVYLREDMLRSGMILLDTPGINTLIERHERLLKSSLSIATSIIYVAGHAPSRVDVDKLSMLTDAGFDVSFVRTHCDEINAQEESLEQVKAADQVPLAKCGIGPERCYYVSNQAASPLFTALDPLRNMLIEKGNDASVELDINIERQLLVQAEQCRAALEIRRALLEQAHVKNTESLEKHQAKLLDKIKRLEFRLEENEAIMRRRIESCCKTLQEDVRNQLETVIRRSGERIEANTTVADEAAMTALLRQESAAFSRNAYQLINASLDPLVQEVNGGIPVFEIGLEPLTLPRAANYQELCSDQGELADDLRDQLTTLQACQADLAQTLAAKAGSPEYLQLQQEFQELQATLVETQQKRANLPPHVPQMVLKEAGRVQLSQLTCSIEAKAKQAALLKDILFASRLLREHASTSNWKEKTDGEPVDEDTDTGMDALRNAKGNNKSGSILDLLTIEHWAVKLCAKFDHPPHLVVDKEYEAQCKMARDKLEATYRKTQLKAYQKKLKMGLLQKEEEQLRAKKESLRIDQEAVSKELAKREAELSIAAKQEALKKWRRDCAIWYQREVKGHLQNVIASYMEDFPARLKEYQRQRSQVLRDALEKEQASYNELKNAPEDEIALELQRVNRLLESINNVFHR